MKQVSDSELIALFDRAVVEFAGNTNELKGAIGALVIARQFGWKPLLLMQDKRTIAKYERILGISFRELTPAVGPQANKSVAWRAAGHIKNFWKAVKGETPGVRSSEILES